MTNHNDGQDDQLVNIRLNGNDIQIKRGVHQIGDLKRLIGVRAEYVLNHVKDGEFHKLNDGDPFHVDKDDEFVCQVPHGGSS